MTTRLLLVAAFVAAAPPVAAQSADVTRQLLAARDTVWHAWFTNDTALLRRYLPPAAASVEGGRDVTWRDRKDILADSRGFVASKSRLVDITFFDTRIALAGLSALVRSHYQLIVASGDRRDTSRGRATELFVRHGATWVNPYWQLEQGASGTSREILLPDTLGANFSIADSTKQAGTLADYDALLGNWEFRFQSRRSDGTYYPVFVGHWTFEKKAPGGLIEDHWRPDDPSTPMAQSLYTYRTFDPERKVWQMIGSTSNGGEIQPGLTWSDATHRFAVQRNHGTISRIRYLSIGPEDFLWRADRSVDGGKTWLLDAGIMEAKRISK